VKTLRIVLQEGRVVTRPLRPGEHQLPPEFSFEEADALPEFS
jgi:hypothetical protein